MGRLHTLEIKDLENICRLRSDFLYFPLLTHDGDMLNSKAFGHHKFPFLKDTHFSIEKEYNLPFSLKMLLK